MEISLKKDLNYNKALIFMSFFAVAFSALGALFGELLVAVSAAFYAAIIVFDTRSKRIFTIIVPIAMVIVNLLIGGYLSLFGIEAIVLAFAMHYLFKKKVRKSTAAAVLVIILLLFLSAALIILVYRQTGEISKDAVVSFYTDIYEKLKEQLLDDIETRLTAIKIGAGKDTFSGEVVEEIFTQVLNNLVSLAVIITFAFAGVALKVYCAILSACAEDDSEVVAWKFGTTSLFAYFYIVLFIANLMVSGAQDSVALTVSNLFNIFMAVYAYVGLKVVFELLKSRYSKFVSFLIIAVGFVLLYSTAVQFLSIVGVYATIFANKHPFDKHTESPKDK